MGAGDPARDRVSFNLDWRFQKDDAAGLGDRLSYATIKGWVAATGVDLVNPVAAKAVRPDGNPGATSPLRSPPLTTATGGR